MLPPDSQAGLFQPCRSSTVLRALLLVQSTLAVAALFTSSGLSEWLLSFAVLTTGSLSATLIWLGASCLFQRQMRRGPALDAAMQLLVHVLMGAAAGWLGCLILNVLALIQHPKWLASTLTGAMLSAGLVGMQLWRNKALQPSETRSRLMELQARIRPHFLFNTLNSAIALLRAEPAKAEALLLDLSELFRAALQDNPTAWTLAQELDLARRYLDIESVRYGSRLRVQWELDPEAEMALLPPLILQPLVENAVRHGVEPSTDGADLWIRTRRGPTGVLIEVSNTFMQGTGTQGHGIALANVRERLALMHDLESRFVCSRSDGRFEVRIEVPA